MYIVIIGWRTVKILLTVKKNPCTTPGERYRDVGKGGKGLIPYTGLIFRQSVAAVVAVEIFVFIAADADTAAEYRFAAYVTDLKVRLLIFSHWSII